MKDRRMPDAAWDDVRSDGEDEDGDQCHKFKAKDHLLPLGQKLEVQRGGSWYLCEVVLVDAEQSYPYTITFPAGEFPDKQCMIDVLHSKLKCPLWSRTHCPFHLVDAEEKHDEDTVIDELLYGQ